MWGVSLWEGLFGLSQKWIPTPFATKPNEPRRPDRYGSWSPSPAPAMAAQLDLLWPWCGWGWVVGWGWGGGAGVELGWWGWGGGAGVVESLGVPLARGSRREPKPMVLQ